jgi:hypothetical protein
MLDELIQLFMPWFAFVGLLFTFVRLYCWARNKKKGAFIFGMLMQMMMPDPYVERTIKVVQCETKQEDKKNKQTSDGE